MKNKKYIKIDFYARKLTAWLILPVMLIFTFSSCFACPGVHGRPQGVDSRFPRFELLSPDISLSINQSSFWYSGYYNDPESGMDYLNARYYLPELRRFISKDTYNLSNRYAYCDGSPVTSVDPNGHMVVSDLIGLASMFALDAGLSIVAPEFEPELICGELAVDVATNVAETSAEEVIVGEGTNANAYQLSLDSAAEKLKAKKAYREKFKAKLNDWKLQIPEKRASGLERIDRKSKEWYDALEAIEQSPKGSYEKFNCRVKTATDAKELLHEAFPEPLRRYKQYTRDNKLSPHRNYENGFEFHNNKNLREFIAGNDLPHLKWHCGTASGHIFFDLTS